MKTLSDALEFSSLGKASTKASIKVSMKTRASQVEHFKFRDLNIQVLRRPYKRTIGINVLVTGRIRVSAPVWVPPAQIEKFLAEHEAWIRSNLQEFKELRDQHPPKRYTEGEEFLLIGENLKLTFAPGGRSSIWVEKQEADRLVVEIPRLEWEAFDRSKSHPELAEPIAAYYREVGIETIQRKLGFYSQVMDLFPTAVLFRAQKSRWGSC
jgi:predicted metal-dependent hydrolase